METRRDWRGRGRERERTGRGREGEVKRRGREGVKKEDGGWKMEDEWRESRSKMKVSREMD